MKLKGIFLVLAILSALSQVCRAQEEKPKAVLFDRFNAVPLGDLWGRIDQFVQHLSQNPNSTGYVIIREERRFKESITNRFYQISRFDEKRFLIVRGAEKNELEIEFWEVPQGAEKPFSVQDMWLEKPRDLSRAFIFGSEGIQEAYQGFAPRRFAKLLNENPSLRANIVVFNKTKKEARDEMQRWLKMFTEDYKLPRRRLKFFFIKNDGNLYVEFWIVPEK
jgi:hypothetical protein